jgi:adenosylcobinamide kinase/adenosylcobinamide-phosphate guanylyltransferase
MFKKKFEQGCMLVLGGAKSGKSSFALNACNSLDRERIFLATAQALDQEMEERIRRHQA